MQSIAYPRRVVLCWAPHRIVIFIYLAFCKRNFQWNLNSSTVVVVGFCCVLFDAMSAVFNFNQHRDSGRLRQTQFRPNGGCRDGLPACPDRRGVQFSGHAVELLLCATCSVLVHFFAPFTIPCVCVRQQPQNHFTSLSFNKLYNIFNLKRNKINLLTIVEQSSASSGTPLSFTNPSPSRLLSCDYCFHLTLATLASFM